MDHTIETRRAMQGECIECAQPLPEDCSVKRIFCGDPCRKRYARKVRRQAIAEADQRTCAQCAASLAGRKASAVYCSRACGSKARRRGRLRGGRCLHCGARLAQKPAGRRGPAPSYCDRKCRAKAKHVRSYVPSSIGSSRPGRRKYDVGHCFGDLVVVEYLGLVGSSIRLRCRCECGTVGDYALSNLRDGRTTRCANRDFHPHPLARQTPPTDYDAAHKYVRRINGRPSAFVCRCGKPAEQWAYSHADLDAQRNDEGREAGRPFSADPAHYVPMCRSCHTRFDRAHSALSAGGNSLVHHAFWLVDQAERNDEVA